MKQRIQQWLSGGRRAGIASPSGVLMSERYLSQHDFYKMMGIAFAVHVLVIGIAALVPSDSVTDIPVRALSFKLGDGNQIAAYNPAPMPAMQVTEPETAAAPVMETAREDSWRAVPEKPSPVVPAPLKPVKKPKPQPKPEPNKKEKVVNIEEQLKKMPPSQVVATQPAIAPTPQQYVREVGGAPDGAIGGKGNETTMTEQTMQEIRSRYEQEISSWIQRHKMYPAEASGREGRAIIRVRIDRSGNVRYYAIEQSSGLQALDNAALDMIRRANPVPAVPANYPSGNLVEFLIPISFKAPS